MARLGPNLPRPRSDTLKGCRHFTMKELRIQHKGRPCRVLYAFDPQTLRNSPAGRREDTGQPLVRANDPDRGSAIDEPWLHWNGRKERLAKSYKLLQAKMSPEAGARTQAKAMLARPGGRGQSAQECSVLWADNHKRPGAEIIIEVRRTAAVRPPPVRLTPLDPLPSLPEPSVKDQLYVLVRRKMFSQRLPKIRLISRHDDQASHPVPSRLCFW